MKILSIIGVIIYGFILCYGMLKKEIKKKDKVIKTLIDDLQSENYFQKMSYEEILKYYEKRLEVKDE